jgi:hypothetical protein
MNTYDDCFILRDWARALPTWFIDAVTGTHGRSLDQFPHWLLWRRERP